MFKLMQKVNELTSKFAHQDTCELCAVEELAELITAIQHKCRNRPVNLAEEIAHVTLMLEGVRKKYDISIYEILFYEWDMVHRYLNDKEWDSSHTPSKVRHNIKYSRNEKTFTYTTDGYVEAWESMENLRKQPNVQILAFYPSDEEGNTPDDVSTWV